MQKIRFNYADRKLNISGKTAIKNYISYIFENEHKNLDVLNYIFCSDEFLLRINKEYLNHDYYTDIITFDLSESEKIKGEIYISLDRVRENATNENISFREEFLRVAFHGSLHLCGYNDNDPLEIVQMREKEDFYLKMFHVKN